MNELKEKNKVRPSRNVKAKVKELQNKMMRNIALKMRLREYFGWGRASFKRNLDRMTGRGYRIPRLGRN